MVQVFVKFFWYNFFFLKLKTKPLWVSVRYLFFNSLTCFSLVNYSNVEFSLIKNIYSFYYHPLSLHWFYFFHLCPMHKSLAAQRGLALILLKRVWPKKLYFLRIWNFCLLLALKTSFKREWKENMICS